MLAAILTICGSFVFTACSTDNDDMVEPEPGAEFRTMLKSLDWGMDTTYVYGHKTPDVDAVCSSLAYAKLMRTLGYNCKAKVSSAKEENDFVIAVVHFGKELSHALEKEQIASARLYIDSGADMVVGHHAHMLQGVEFYKDKPIIYNLGNFIFNADTVDTAIFEVRLDATGNMKYYIIPAIQEEVFTRLANPEEKARIIKDINSWSINAYLDSDGKMIKK